MEFRPILVVCHEMCNAPFLHQLRHEALAAIRNDLPSAFLDIPAYLHLLLGWLLDSVNSWSSGTLMSHKLRMVLTILWKDDINCPSMIGRTNVGRAKRIENLSKFKTIVAWVTESDHKYLFKIATRHLGDTLLASAPSHSRRHSFEIDYRVGPMVAKKIAGQLECAAIAWITVYKHYKKGVLVA